MTDIAVWREIVGWQYRNSTDTEWKDMPQEYSWKHEDKQQRGVQNFEYDVKYCRNEENTYHYCVDLNEMTQTNTKTGTVRRLRRSR